MRRWLRILAFLAPIAVAHPVAAAPCSGFTDVDDGSAFCPNVDWLKNRQVTLGCTSSTQYCPTQAVGRLAMAAFLHRLGLALTPSLLYGEASGASLALDSAPTVCATASLPAAAFPRSAKASAVLTGRFAAAGAAGLRLVQSVDNGATWTPVNLHPTSAGGPDRWINASATKSNIPLAINTAYRFGLRVDRAGSGTGNLGAWNCQLEVVAASRTGTSAPF